MNDLISIIIPAYNIGDCLAGCLDSVLAQTHTNIEVVVVDDGSKDHTAEVMRTYAAKDTRIKAIYKENGGVTSARLRGVAEALGEWIGFIDGDDYIEPMMFERLLQNATDYNADISHCGYQMVFPNGRVDYYYNTGRLAQQDTLTGLKDLLEGSFVEPGLCNKLFHKSLFHSLLHGERMPADIKTNEDLLMNYYLFKASSKSIYEDICPYHYVLRKGSAATSKLNEHKLRDPIRVLDIIYQDTINMTDVQKVVQARRAYQMINIVTLPFKDQKELIKPYRCEMRKRLRRELKPIFQNNHCSKKVKWMALWATVWPWSYGAVHCLYGLISGKAHKYDVG